MLKKVSVKPILELCAIGISMRKIESLIHVSRHTILLFIKPLIFTLDHYDVAD